MLGCESAASSQVSLFRQAKEQPHLFSRMEVPAASITQLDAVMCLSSGSQNISRSVLWDFQGCLLCSVWNTEAIAELKQPLWGHEDAGQP